MSGFIASPPSPASPAGAIVSVGSFWPSIDINRFRDAMRIGNQDIPHPRVVEALLGAAIITADNLADWRAVREAEGHVTLADVPAEAITHGAGETASESRLAILWRRAVHAFAAADLIETHRDVTATGTGVSQIEHQAMTPDDHRRNGVHAIRAILGQRRTAVELI
ncbi:MAG: hypothetical protein BGP16_12950 [Sphingobium sp. 66-54]|nr:MAG: hypothetical protein BGP16_12950 [Sphingobium sp. 66-54]